MQYWLQLQNRLAFQLKAAANCQADLDFRLSLILEDGSFTEKSLERILEWGRLKHLHAKNKAASLLALQLLQTAEDLGGALKRRKTVPLNSIVLQPSKFDFHQMAQSLFNEDFSHFQAERMPGGIRLFCPDGPEGRSAFSCAEAMDFAYLPTPMRKFTPAFRLDLSPSYASLENWDSYQKLLRWADEIDFDLKDLRNWANSVYVARLKDPSQLPLMSKKLLCDELGVKSLELERAVS